MSFAAPAPAPVAQKAAPPAEPPKRTDAEVEDARRKELEKEAKARGRRSNVLTGTRGDRSNPPTISRRVLGGA